MELMQAFFLAFAFCAALSSAETLNQRLDDIDSAVGPTLAKLFKTGPTVVDTTDYEQQIRKELAQSGLTESQQAEVLHERLADYVEDFKETLIADTIKGRLKDLPGLEVDRVIRLDSPESRNLEPAREYYLREYGETVGDAVIVLGKWRGENIAQYATPLFNEAESVGDFADSFTFGGKNISLSFRWHAKVQNADYYLEACYKELFGSPHVMFINRARSRIRMHGRWESWSTS